MVGGYGEDKAERVGDGQGGDQARGKGSMRNKLCRIYALNISLRVAYTQQQRQIQDRSPLSLASLELWFDR